MDRTKTRNSARRRAAVEGHKKFGFPKSGVGTIHSHDKGTKCFSLMQK